MKLVPLACGAWLVFGSSFAHAQSRSALEGLDLAAGRPLGGTLSTATSSPTVRKVRGGFGPLPDIDGRLADRLDQVDSILQARVAQVDTVAADRLDQVNGIVRDRLDQADSIVAGRIAQVGLVGGDLVRTASGEVQSTLKVADSIVESRIAQIDKVAQTRIDQVDQKLGARLGQVQGIALSAIREADGVVAARIDQVDEVAGRRLGNVDTIVSKQLISVESLLLKVPVVIGLIAALVWLGITSLRTFNTEKTKTDKKVKHTLTSLGRFALEAALIFLVTGAFYWLGLEVPGGSQLRARELRMAQSRAFSASLERLDLTAAKFHASQLAFLAGTDTSLGTMNVVCKLLPDAMRKKFATCLERADDEPLDEATANSALARVTLLRDVLITPSALTTKEGRATMLERVAQLMAMQGTSPVDSDEGKREEAARQSLEALAAVIRFHGAVDAGELPALVPALNRVCDEGHSVLDAKQAELANRVFGDLACETLRAIRSALPSREWLAATGREGTSIALKDVGAERAIGQFRTTVAGAHLQLLNAQVEVCRAGGEALPTPKKGERVAGFQLTVEQCRTARKEGNLTQTLEKRRAAAQQVVAAWKALFDAVGTEASAAEARAQLLLFDDAALSFALAAAGSNAVLPPPLSLRELQQRAQSFPPRVALMEEVFGERSRPVQALAAEVEARRFLAFEELEYFLMRAQLGAAKPEGADLVKVALTLELKGLLPVAMKDGWVDPVQLKAALARTGPVALPIRRVSM